MRRLRSMCIRCCRRSGYADRFLYRRGSGRCRHHTDAAAAQRCPCFAVPGGFAACPGHRLLYAGRAVRGGSRRDRLRRCDHGAVYFRHDAVEPGPGGRAHGETVAAARRLDRPGDSGAGAGWRIRVPAGSRRSRRSCASADWTDSRRDLVVHHLPHRRGTRFHAAVGGHRSGLSPGMAQTRTGGARSRTRVRGRSLGSAAMIRDALALAAILFGLGLVGVLVRRNILFVLMSVEVMLSGAALAFIAAGARWGQPDGQVVFLFILAMAAAEVSVGLALLLALYHQYNTLDTNVASRMKG